MNFLHRAWAQINLDNLLNNFSLVRKAANGSMVMSVVKADAYGHGAVEVARALSVAGTDWFAVSNLEEALELRLAGISEPILVLGTTPPEYAKELSDNNITQTVFCADYAAELARNATTAGVTVNIHIKLDTGMRRLGFNAADDDQIKQAIIACGLNGLNPEGVFTHFASADMDGDSDGAFTLSQYNLFCRAVDAIESSGIKFSLRHCSNSAATLTRPNMALNMVRAGIILYGLAPSEDVAIDGFKPVMSLHAAVSMVKSVKAGDQISYGRTYTAPYDITVATVPIGYADGYMRAFSGGRVIVGGRRANNVGRICMDQMMLDVTGLDVKVGDTVTLFGTDGDNEISVDELAKLAGTINYEIICLLSKRITRVYVEGGNEIGYKNLLNRKDTI